MPTSSEESPPVQGDSNLRAALEALASEARLRLLREICTPKTLKEIKVRVVPESGPHRSGERYLARQAVKDHLDRLEQVGVVVARETIRAYGPAIEYVVNHQALFALAEEFRALAKLRPAEEPALQTRRGRDAEAPPEFVGPCLVLVHGLYEGRTFGLTPSKDGGGEWVIGRRRGLGVSLDFDPFVSSENARVILQDGDYVIEDLAVSRNGTSVNFRSLPKAGRSRLRTGDLVGVGRSLLLFRA